MIELIQQNQVYDELIEEISHDDYQHKSKMKLCAFRLFSHLKDEALASKCPMPESETKLCAQMLLNRMKGEERKEFLNEKLRCFVAAYVEMFELLDADLFDRSQFAKALQPLFPLPIELLWWLHRCGMLEAVSYLTTNSSDSSIPKHFTESLSDILCKKSTCERKIANNIITDLATALILSAFPPLSFLQEEFNALQKVAEDALNNVTINILNFIYESKDPYETPPILFKLVRETRMVKNETLKTFCLQQISVIVNFNPFPAVQAISNQESWSFFKSPNHFVEIFIQLLVPLEQNDVVVLLQNLVGKQQINWKALLTLVSTFVVVFCTGAEQIKNVILNLLKLSFENVDNNSLTAAILMARQASLEGQKVFPSYANWFQSVFGSLSNTLMGNKKCFCFFVEFLLNVLPYEPSSFLKVHVMNPPYIYPKCHHLYSEYTACARTRLKELKQQLEDSSTSDEKKLNDKQKVPLFRFKIGPKVEADVENAIDNFTKGGKIPTFVTEMSMFRKPYFVGEFLKTLLKPRPLPKVPDQRTKLIDALLKSSKITTAMHTQYLNLCQMKETTRDEELACEDTTSQSFQQFEAVLVSIGLKLVLAINSNDRKESSSILCRISQLVKSALKDQPQSRTHDVLVLNVSVPNVPLDTIKVIDVVINTFCKTHASIKSATSGSELKWAPEYIRMIASNSCLHYPLYLRLWELLIEKTRLALNSLHIEALGSLMFNLHQLRQSLPMVMLQCNAGNKLCSNVTELTFIECIGYQLPIETYQDRQWCLQFLTSYIRSMVMEETFRYENIPETFIIKFQFLALRELPSIRGIRDQQTKFEESKDIYESDSFQNLITSHQLSFDHWIQYEMEIESEDMKVYDRQSYFDWMVYCHYATKSLEDGGFNNDYRQCCSSLLRKLISPNVCCKCGIQHLNQTDTTAAILNLTKLLQEIIISSLTTAENDSELPWLLTELKHFYKKHRGTRNFFRVAQNCPAYLLFTDTVNVKSCNIQQISVAFAEIFKEFKQTSNEDTVGLTETTFILRGLYMMQDQKLVNSLLNSCSALTNAMMMHWNALQPTITSFRTSNLTFDFAKIRSPIASHSQQSSQR